MTKATRVPAAVRWAGQLLAWFVMLSVGAALLVALIVPRLAGATPYVIETGSMSPTMPPGTLVVVRPVPADEVTPGDVITYQIKSGDPTVVTHRVVRQGVDMTGQPRWRTQGDANRVADKDWVEPVQLKGERWYSIPYLGYATSFISNQQRGFIGGLVVLVLLGYAFNAFRKALQERRGRRADPASAPAGEPGAGERAVERQAAVSS